MMLPPGWRASVAETDDGELLLRVSDGTTTAQRPLRLPDVPRTWLELVAFAWANPRGFIEVPEAGRHLRLVRSGEGR